MRVARRNPNRATALMIKLSTPLLPIHTITLRNSFGVRLPSDSWPQLFDCDVIRNGIQVPKRRLACGEWLAVTYL